MHQEEETTVSIKDKQQHKSLVLAPVHCGYKKALAAVCVQAPVGENTHHCMRSPGHHQKPGDTQVFPHSYSDAATDAAMIVSVNS